MTVLDEPRLLVTVLPADPLASIVEFDDGLLHVLPQRFTGQTANGVEFLGGIVVTDDALGRFAEGSGGRWRAYAGIRRSGGVEIGVGSSIRYDFGSTESRSFAYRLYYIIHAVRVVIESQARLVSHAPLSESLRGPFELDVALAGTAGAFLGGLADGREEPSVSSWGISRCMTENVLVRTQFEAWPATPEDEQAALLKVGDRVCNAFGTTERLFAPPNGRPGAGRLSPAYA